MMSTGLVTKSAAMLNVFEQLGKVAAVAFSTGQGPAQAAQAAAKKSSSTKKTPTAKVSL